MTTRAPARRSPVPEATVAHRISSAKQRIRACGTAFAAPTESERADRMPVVLLVLYLIFNEGYVGARPRARGPGADRLHARARAARLLAPERAQELAAPAGHAADELAHLRDARPQLRVADLDRQHRVLELGEQRVGLGGRVDGLTDEPLDPLRRRARRRRLEAPAGQAVAVREAGLGTPGTAVGDLHGPEQLALEPVGAELVELLIRRAQRRERDPDLLGRVRQRGEQVAAPVAGRICHARQVIRAARATKSPRRRLRR